MNGKLCSIDEVARKTGSEVEIMWVDMELAHYSSLDANLIPSSQIPHIYRL